MTVVTMSLGGGGGGSLPNNNSLNHIDPIQTAIWHCVNNYAYADAIFLGERLLNQQQSPSTANNPIHSKEIDQSRLHVLSTAYYRAGRKLEAYELLASHAKGIILSGSNSSVPSSVFSSAIGRNSTTSSSSTTSTTTLSHKNRFLLATIAFDIDKLHECESVLVSSSPSCSACTTTTTTSSTGKSTFHSKGAGSLTLSPPTLSPLEQIERSYMELSSFALKLFGQVCLATDRAALARDAISRALKLNPFLFDAFETLAKVQNVENQKIKDVAGRVFQPLSQSVDVLTNSTGLVVVSAAAPPSDKPVSAATNFSTPAAGPGPATGPAAVLRNNTRNTVLNLQHHNNQQQRLQRNLFTSTPMSQSNYNQSTMTTTSHHPHPHHHPHHHSSSSSLSLLPLTGANSQNTTPPSPLQQQQQHSFSSPLFNSHHPHLMNPLVLLDTSVSPIIVPGSESSSSSSATAATPSIATIAQPMDPPRAKKPCLRNLWHHQQQQQQQAASAASAAVRRSSRLHSASTAASPANNNANSNNTNLKENNKQLNSSTTSSTAASVVSSPRSKSTRSTKATLAAQQSVAATATATSSTTTTTGTAAGGAGAGAGAVAQQPTTVGGEVAAFLHAFKAAADPFLSQLRELGQAYLHVSRYECREAIAILQQHQQQSNNRADFVPSSPWVLATTARAYFELALYDRAVAFYSRLRSSSRYRLDGLEWYSTALWHLQREVELSALSQELLVEPENKKRAQTWIVLGNCFSLHKEHDHAIKFFKRAIQSAGCGAYAYTLLGHEYVQCEELEKALRSFRSAARLDHTHYNAWYGIGMIYYKQERFHQAETYFKKAIALHPQNSVLLCHLGVVQNALGRTERSLVTFTDALRVNPTDPLCKFHRASVLFAVNRLDEALAELEELKTIVPKESLVHFLVAKIHSKRGETHKALLHFSWATDLDPKGVNNHIKESIEPVLSRNTTNNGGVHFGHQPTAAATTAAAEASSAASASGSAAAPDPEEHNNNDTSQIEEDEEEEEEEEEEELEEVSSGTV